MILHTLNSVKTFPIRLTAQLVIRYEMNVCTKAAIYLTVPSTGKLVLHVEMLLIFQLITRGVCQ